jgi:hypothetical protein
MIDHVEAHLRRERTETMSEQVRYRHLVCEAAGLVLKNVIEFKNHVETVHGISLREQRYIW